MTVENVRKRISSYPPPAIRQVVTRPLRRKGVSPKRVAQEKPLIISDAPPSMDAKIKTVADRLVKEAADIYGPNLVPRFRRLKRSHGEIEVFSRDADGTCRINMYQAQYALPLGGMAEVTLAVGANGKPVVVKELKEERYRDEEALAGLHREAEIAAMDIHPAVLSLLDFHNMFNRCQIVLPFVKGTSLREFIQFRSQLSLSFALAIVCKMLEICIALQKHGILHRDLKPENILINTKEGGSILTLLDFGLARKGQSVEYEHERVAWGTKGYVAPEIVENGSRQASSVQSELFSIGRILQNLFVGRIPSDIQTFVTWLTRPEPQHRPQSFEAALAEARRLFFVIAS